LSSKNSEKIPETDAFLNAFLPARNYQQIFFRLQDFTQNTTQKVT